MWMLSQNKIQFNSIQFNSIQRFLIIVLPETLEAISVKSTLIECVGWFPL